ncbi:MAG: TspO/MBR family protein [Bacteroidota bacterium]
MKPNVMVLRIIVFLLLNFGGLAFGGLFTEVNSDWYQGLNRAPWTPPGWVFGAAWTTIMICFSIYMAFLWGEAKDKKPLVINYLLAFILNAGWNPVFFHFRQVALGLVVIVALTVVVTYFIFRYWNTLKSKTLLMAPYFIWLLIATSLNAYVLFKN